MLHYKVTQQPAVICSSLSLCLCEYAALLFVFNITQLAKGVRAWKHGQENYIAHIVGVCVATSEPLRATTAQIDLQLLEFSEAALLVLLLSILRQQSALIILYNLVNYRINVVRLLKRLQLCIQLKFLVNFQVGAYL